jgi:hypothetical protein
VQDGSSYSISKTPRLEALFTASLEGLQHLHEVLRLKYLDSRIYGKSVLRATLNWRIIANALIELRTSSTLPRCYRFRLEDQVPETHLLRLIEKHISFAFVREKLKASYSDTGRPSIDPELLLRILLIGYLYGITSERKLVEELRMHLAWRWFTGLGFDQEIPHHSTFSKNRHGRRR